MKISLAQINSTVGDLEYNYSLISSAAKEALDNNVSLLITPELSLTGYPPEDLLLNSDFLNEVNKKLLLLAKENSQIMIIVGHPLLHGKNLFNAASVLYKGKIFKSYKKQILPNYGVFDEKRYFVPGDSNLIFNHEKYKIGVLICEDVWSDLPIENLIKNNIDLIVCINASPYEINKNYYRIKNIKRKIKGSNTKLIYLNAVGGQDDLLFDGGSFILDSNLGLVLSLPQFKTINKIVDLKFLVNEETKEHISTTNILFNGLVLALKDYLRKNSINKIFLGLSGGIDSAVVLCIAAKACKKNDIQAIMMPTKYTSKMSLDDAKKLTNNIGIKYTIKRIDSLNNKINKMFEEEFSDYAKDTTEENIQARIRGLLLMAYANKFNGVVLATSNKSETAVGYATLYGDMVGGFSILKDVPKTWVYKLAKYINEKQIIIPNRIITRPPTAELKDNQSDQDSLPDYELLDGIIDLYLEKNQSPSAIIKKGYPELQVKKVVGLIHSSEFKRRQSAPGPKVTNKAFGKERRYPITNNFRITTKGNF
ncbi:NAD+ synthase [Methylophilaceae bacterium]|jgi:NAD+ synthase (glutamine-hydrolysing)|nr:NAD+ synthase [Methylophilaceae bacterium]